MGITLKIFLKFDQNCNPPCPTLEFRGISTFQCGSQSVERILKMCKINHVYHWPKLGRQPNCAHQELQRTHGGVEDHLQHSWDEKFVQTSPHLPEVCYLQNARRKWFVKFKPRQQVQDVWGSICLFENENIVMTLLKSLPVSYEYLIIAMKTMSMNGFTIDYVIPRLMHEMSKNNDIKLQGKDIAMVLQ